MILSKVGGGIVTEQEARAILQPYGSIELCAPTQTFDAPRGKLYGSMYVKFAFYLDCQDALKVSIHLVSTGFYANRAPVIPEPHIWVLARHRTVS